MASQAAYAPLSSSSTTSTSKSKAAKTSASATPASAQAESATISASQALVPASQAMPVRPPVYLTPLPGLNDGSAYLCAVYTPHVASFFYGDVQKNKYGGNVVYKKAWKGASANITLQFGTKDQPMRAPFGLSKKYDPQQKMGGGGGSANNGGGGAKTAAPTDKAGGGGGEADEDTKRLNLDLSIEDADVEAFLRAVDDKNRAMCVQRMKEWFPDTQVENDTEARIMLKTLYRACVQPAKQKPNEPVKDYKPTFRTKVVLEGDQRTNVVVKVGEDAEGNPVCVPGTWHDLFEKRGARVIVRLEDRGLWFNSGKYGQNFVDTDVMLVPQAERVAGGFVGMNVKMQTAATAAPAAVGTGTVAPGAGDDFAQYMDGAVPEAPML